MFEVQEYMLDKKVCVTCTDGQVFIGKMTDWTSELDNDPEPESISLDDWLGIPVPEIEKIEIIG